MNSLIKTNLLPLCEKTRVNQVLLLFLIQKELITDELKEEIENSPTSVKKASMLYEYFMKSPDSDFEEILEGLDLSGNFQAVEILAPGRNKGTIKRNKKTAKHNADDPPLAPFQKFKTSNLNLKWPISHEIIPPVKNFTGREKELKQLNTFFLNKQNLVLVCGLGGIGKTELCRKFMENKTAFFCGIFNRKISRVWLYGDTFESFNSSIFTFACELGVKNYKATPFQMFKFLTKMILSHNQKLLVVIDNVDTKVNEVSEVIQMITRYENIFLIVTSRNKNVLDNTGETILLDVLSQPEARKSVRNLINNVSDSDANLVCKLVENYPLAIQQAVSYINEQRENPLTETYSVSDYVKEFEEKKSEILDQKLEKPEHDFDYAMTPLVTWDVTFNKLNEDAIEVLKILAFLDPDKISVDFFEEICIEFGLKDKFKNAINALKRYSLIKVEDSVISTQRLVQDMMRHKVGDDFSKKIFHVVMLVLLKSNSLILNDGLPHLKSICQVTHGIEIDYSNSNKFKNQVEFFCSLQSQIAYKLFIKNEYNSSLELFKELLSSKYNTAHNFAFKELIRLSKSNSNSLVVLLLENLIESINPTSLNDHEKTTMLKIVLAEMLIRCGKPERSQELFKQVKSYYDANSHLKVSTSFTGWFVPTIIIWEKNMSRDNDDILKSHRTLNLWDLDFKDLERLLLVYKSVLGENYELTVQVKKELADNFFWNNEFAKCLELIEQVISSNIEYEVKCAYYTMYIIGIRYFTKENYNEARNLFEKVLKFHKAHNSSLIFQNVKCRLALVKLGCQLNYAMTLYSETLPHYETKWGKDHSCTKEIHDKITQLSKK